jgi:hypothetical protein
MEASSIPFTFLGIAPIDRQLFHPAMAWCAASHNTLSMMEALGGRNPVAARHITFLYNFDP